MDLTRLYAGPHVGHYRQLAANPYSHMDRVKEYFQAPLVPQPSMFQTVPRWKYVDHHHQLHLVQRVYQRHFYQTD